MKTIHNIKTYVSSYRFIAVILMIVFIIFNPTKISPILLPILMGLEILIKSFITHIIQVFQHQGGDALKHFLMGLEILIKSFITHIIQVFQHQGGDALKHLLTSIWK